MFVSVSFWSVLFIVVIPSFSASEGEEEERGTSSLALSLECWSSFGFGISLLVSMQERTTSLQIYLR
jgi:succinate-acetate transporter protein